jgi:hypothetical protein
VTASEEERAEFEEIVRSFAFLSEAGMNDRGVRGIGSGGRGSGLVARYEAPVMRLEIGWSEFELALGIMLKYNLSELPDEQRYVFFEPFVEFLTEGREGAIVPFVSDNMSSAALGRVMGDREAVFADGLAPVAERLAAKLKRYFDQVRDASGEQIVAYHAWMKARR